MIWDGILFHNEVDMLRLHLSVLAPVVDRFIIVEGAFTFSGKPKPHFNFIMNAEKFKEWDDKIDFYPLTTAPDPNRWVNERNQRNWLAKGLMGASPDDVVMISDTDEIADPEVVQRLAPVISFPQVFDTYAYYYYLDYLMEPQEQTTCKSIMIGRRKHVITPQGFREMRLSVLSVKAGWHFSYLGGPQAIREKISAFSHAEYDSPYYKDENHLKAVAKEKRDLFDRQGINFKSVPIQYPTHPKFLVDHIKDWWEYTSWCQDFLDSMEKK